MKSRGRADWLLVDASSLMFRAFYGIPLTVRSPKGEPVNAVRGFLDMLGRLIAMRDPARVVVATDEDWRPAFRVKVLPSYKAHRVEQAMPAPLAPQVSIIEHLLAAIGIEVVGAAGYEAEDVIASLLPRIRGSAEIASGDRDLFALVRDPDVRVLYLQAGVGQLVVVDEAEIERRYRIPGRRYGDFAILRGDPSDGLPGLPGVGPTTAAAMLRRYGDVDAVLREAKLAPQAREYLDRARQVVLPVSTIALQRPRGRRPQSPSDPPRLQRLNESYGLLDVTSRLLRTLRGEGKMES